MGFKNAVRYGALTPQHCTTSKNLHAICTYLVSAHTPYEACCISYSNACLVIHIDERGNGPTDGQGERHNIKSSFRNVWIAFMASTHLETHRQRSQPPNISPLSNPAQSSAMPWPWAMQLIVCKSCKGIASRDVISAPFPVISCWISVISGSERY